MLNGANMLQRLGAAWRAFRSLENPNLALNDPRAWAEAGLLDGGTDTGIRVTHEGALRYAPVLQAVTMISGDAAKLPISVYKRQPTIAPSARVVDKRHPAFRLVRHRANDEISAFKFWRRFFTHVLLWGNAYAFIERDNAGRPISIINLLPDRTQPERVAVNGPQRTKLIYTTEVRGPGGHVKVETLDPSEVLHVEGVNINNVQGVDLVGQMRNAWSLGLALEGFAAKFFRQGARVGGVLEIPNTFAREAADTLEEGFTKKHVGPDNWFRVAILREGAKFHSTTIAPQEAQLIEAGEAVVRNVARSFNLPPARLGLQDAVSYNSQTEANQAYLDSTLSPWLTAIADECWSKLLTRKQQDNDTHYFEHNTSRLLSLDPLKKAQIDAIYIRNQVKSPDDVRADLNMNPRDDGKGGEFVTPGAPSPQQVGGDNDGKVDNDGPQPEKGGDEKEKPSDEKKRAHELTRVIFELGARGRHKAKNARAFIEWVDGDLAYHRKQFSDLVGEGAEDFFAPIVGYFRSLVDVATPDELPIRVDQYLTKLERGSE